MSAPAKMSAIDSGVENGVEWATCQAPLYGAVNGYVRVPEGHPWSGMAYSDINVEVHGGLTYEGADGWIGFDTLHSGDYWPECPDHYRDNTATHWTAEMVAEEAKKLARAVSCCDRAAGRCEFCGCCPHSPDDGWCRVSKAPVGMRCPEPGCGCEGWS